MKSSRRHWMILIAGAALFLAGVAYDGMIAELPRGNPPPALMDYYHRHHRIATMITGVGCGLLLLRLSLAAITRFSGNR